MRVSCVCVFVFAFILGSFDVTKQRNMKIRVRRKAHTPKAGKPQRSRGLHSRFVVQARIQKKQNDFLLTHN